MEETQLCDAHLFPRAMRKFVSDDPKDPHFYHAEAFGPGAEKRYTFFFDREILCAKCDGSLSDYDNTFVKFVSNWQNDPRRTKPIFELARYRHIDVDTLAAPLQLGILISLYRFALSSKYGDVQLSTSALNTIREMIIAKGGGPLPYRVLILAYYHRWIEGRGFRIDASDIGRPFPAKWSPHGYLIELFGLSIFIDIEGSSKMPASFYLGGGTEKTRVHLTDIENGTPSFTHVLGVLREGAARISAAGPKRSAQK